MISKVVNSNSSNPVVGSIYPLDYQPSTYPFVQPSYPWIYPEMKKEPQYGPTIESQLENRKRELENRINSDQAELVRVKKMLKGLQSDED